MKGFPPSQIADLLDYDLKWVEGIIKRKKK
jgi:hypothetical protein